jgi:hypothetical protein
MGGPQASLMLAIHHPAMNENETGPEPFQAVPAIRTW